MDVAQYRRGVGAVLFNRDGLVFVGRRIDAPQDAWQLPQGGIHRGESPEDAVMRELAEEIGTEKVEIIGQSSAWMTYDLPEHLIGRVWKGKFRGQHQLWFALKFIGDDSDVNLVACSDPEFDAWRWVKIEEIPLLVVPFKRPVYVQLVREFRDFVQLLNGANR